MKKTKLLPLIVLVLGLAACNSAHRHDNKSVYIEKSRLEAIELAPAPQRGSPVDQADFIELHDWQNKRTAQQCAAAGAEGNAYLEDFFGHLKPFSAPLPAAGNKFILRVREDASTAVTIFKDRNSRPRPFLSDAALDPCIGRAGGLAYPSGHATLSRLFALMLTELAPLRRSEFMAVADAAALNRVIGGVHHPSDIEAGKKLGDLLFARFMENPEFRANMDKLRPYMAK
ncbi:MAG TPA: hypothetical protein DCZ92_04660 [Elusimicrobia bacterium]|nr:MAG: hypothetical protein A2016_10160 [Elusimicrobia bacterium GWF2_62_30]HBA60099.1 hypothetical protein [Elusimicrobiota bacterium]